MKTTLGGERLGSGKKQIYTRKNFERSTHNLSKKFRSSMSAGTVVPFMNYVALPGDSFDIDLNCEVLTLPTVGPLFGSFKVQLDVFYAPVKLYNASLQMNRVNIGNDMSDIPLPLMEVRATKPPTTGDFADFLDDNAQINPSCLLKYFDISGIGRMIPANTNQFGIRRFTALKLLMYWDIYKTYYSNKQEERGFAIHTDTTTVLAGQAIQFVYLNDNGTYVGDILLGAQNAPRDVTTELVFGFGAGANQPDPNNITILVGGGSTQLDDNFGNFVWDDELKTLTCNWTNTVAGNVAFQVNAQNPVPLNFTIQDYVPSLVEFPLSNIDDMRFSILQHTPQNTPFIVNTNSPAPYSFPFGSISTASTGANALMFSSQFSQEALGVKTYQSDLFNNWLDTEWIDGVNGINAVTAVDTTGNSFTIDALNLAHKVYNMLNRVAFSGGTYDDWNEAVYDHYSQREINDPIYYGSLIKELGFEEVISTANADAGQVSQALGTLAGRGRLTGKHKGGKIRIKVDRIGMIMGVVSITPRIEYSQGNAWDNNLLTMDDFHKPDLDRIGYQDLMTGQLAWQNIQFSADTNTIVSEPSAGKQPAWINYMTEVDRVYGNFADRNKEMFMTLNRRYDIDPVTGLISDLTTYIDPAKFNQIFADTNLDAQNFWVQIGAKVIARRKMSAKVIPNL